MEFVNILTRTSGRPQFFRENCKSINDQSYQKIRHIVSVDDQESEDYVKDLKDTTFPQIEYHRLEKQICKGNGHFPFNLYMNELQSHVTEGWIMFLDDDDIFIDSDAVSNIMANIKSEDDLLLWRVRFPNNRIIPKHLGRKPRMGDVSCIGFMFHSKWIPEAVWGDRKGGDYRIIKKLFDILQPVWIDQVLTAVNYENNRPFGSGQRHDKTKT
jgi:hypothetical protein